MWISVNGCVFALMVFIQTDLVLGHGRLIEPAARNAMWRYKYKNPRNYNDMGLNCGGFTNQFERQHGRCGTCGDPWQGPFEHEAGGKYANGVVARQYRVGQLINVTAELTSNHQGYFEFRLCPVNNPRKRVTQQCLDSNLLNILGHGSRYFISEKQYTIFISLTVMLPPNLKCSQCVLQWKYVAGQSMGPDGMGGECLGCGNQEHFVNCADVAIGARPVAPLPIPESVLNNVEAPPAPATPMPPTKRLGPAYSVNTNNAISGYHSNMGMSNQIYKMSSHNNLQPFQSTTIGWNSDPNMMYGNIGMIGMNQIPQTATIAPWGDQWQPVQNFQWQQPKPQVQVNQWQQPKPQAQVNQWQQPKPQVQVNQWQQPNPHVQTQQWQQQSQPSHQSHQAMLANLSPYIRERLDWVTEAPVAKYPTQPPAPSVETPEPGEYPEVGEGQSSSSSYGSGGSSSSAGGGYMQGFNDAIRQIKERLGMAGGHQFNTKSGNALSEIALSMQESRKHGGITCRGLDRSKGASMDKWCHLNCKQNNCPSDMCVCG